MRLAFFGFIFLISFPASGQITIDAPWARATAPGAAVAGGYMVIRNAGAVPDRLVGASSSVSARVQLHVHVQEGGVIQMREVPGYDVPAKGSFELKPGGAHLMLVDIRQPLKEGDRVPVTLRFEKAGELSAEFRVGKLGASAPAGAPPAHHNH